MFRNHRKESLLDYIFLSGCISFAKRPHVALKKCGNSDHYLIDCSIQGIGYLRNRMKKIFLSNKINLEENEEEIGRNFMEIAVAKDSYGRFVNFIERKFKCK